jgi:hypothetical protein
MNLYQVAEELSRRLSGMFLKGKDDRRPVNGQAQKLQTDPHWCDYVQFYEYFHGDTGAGLGASHQTGWTGVIARSMHLFATTDAEQVLELGKLAAVIEKGEPRKELATPEPRKELVTKEPRKDVAAQEPRKAELATKGPGKESAAKERKERKGNGSPLVNPGSDR